MELYHDEYSVFYDYDDEDDEVDDEDSKPSKMESGVRATPGPESDFDEDFDDDDVDENGDSSNHFEEIDDEDSQQNSSNCENLENTDGTYRCPLCPKEVVSKYNLKRHMMIHTGEKPHKCRTCYKGFREQSDLRKHMKVHTYGNRLFECGTCQRSYLSYKSVKCYYCDGDDEDAPPPNTYDEDTTKLYNCFLCSVTQLNTQQLKEHLVQVHPATSRGGGGGGTGSGTLGAVTNGTKSCLNGSTQKTTKSADDMEKIHKCNVCTKAFRSKQFLMLHTLTHANNRIEAAF